MNARSDAVTEQIRSAMQSSNPRDIVTGVKEAVAQEVNALSPDAKIVVTDYFNHSYMPDLVVHWNEAGKPDERPIFLRNSLRPAVVEHELQTLAMREPVVLSLTRPVESDRSLDTLRARARLTNRSLVTDVGSLADVAEPSTLPDRAGAPESVGAPLLRLVRANLLKGGRGLFTSDDAERLTRSAAPSDDSLSEEFLASFEESADELFVPDAALRLRRAAELLRFGLSRDVVEILPLASGQLSDVELRVLLPYLLSDPTASTRRNLWSYIGSMMNLERLEDIGELLADVDVTALVVPNVEAWTAKRSQLVLNNEDEETVTEADPPSWHVRNRMLTADVGRWRLFITTDKRRLRGRTDSVAAHWDDISSLLTEFALDAVDLRGVSRRIRVSAEESGDVRGDVALIRESIEDSFHVTDVNVRRLGDSDAATSMKVDFTEMTVTAEAAPVASFVAAAGLLGHRWPTDFSALVDQDPGRN
ncbi:hypothetical protein [Kibdelosporangium phytohabitans]|uniref:Uncharacterized protein n=1 Tax=Kibdelosporangium phytohabitans TaxID=860235 RepID=A0A0N9HW63_9PSEU|nr:hypothetical protein [Kibdelosporangium phytohabitans]ALG06221.1 hypothetical protein AOZ06_04110 [Kibdelosporangium phytohabitans]MBE1465681.1 hypothetical protein [Kibdelosporangium phytohabitans]